VNIFQNDKLFLTFSTQKTKFSKIDDWMKEKTVLTSTELAYWIGVVQSDGIFKIYPVKGRKHPRYEISINVSEKSLPMLFKFQEICKNVFNRNVKIFKIRKRNAWTLNIRVKSLLDTFHKLDIKFNKSFNSPTWCLGSPELFGSYLAGVIDGDGSVTLTKRSEYLYCLIRIYSGNEEKELVNHIKKILNCGVSVQKRTKKNYFAKENRFINGTWYELHFLVSSKNYEFLKIFVLPHITINYKKGKIQSFIQKFESNKSWGSRIVSIKAYNGLLCQPWEKIPS